MEVVVIFICLLAKLTQLNAANLLEIKVLQYPQGVRLPTNLIATSAGFIAPSHHSLLFIDLNLEHVSSYRDQSFDRETAGVSGVLVTDDGSFLLYCFYDGSCSYAMKNPDQSFPGFGNYSGTLPKAAAANVEISLLLADETVYIASSAAISLQNEGEIRISQSRIYYQSIMNESINTRMRITNVNFVSREFFFSFYDDGYVYFIALDTVVDSWEKSIRLIRTCHHDNDTENIWSMFEVDIDCGLLTGNSTIVGVFQSNQTVVLVLSGVAGSDAFCVFTLADINEVATQAYSRCLEGNYKFQLPWSATASSCILFKQVNLMGKGIMWV